MKAGRVATVFLFSAHLCLVSGTIAYGFSDYVPAPDIAAQVGQALIYGKPVEPRNVSTPGSGTSYGLVPVKAFDGSLPDPALLAPRTWGWNEFKDLGWDATKEMGIQWTQTELERIGGAGVNKLFMTATVLQATKDMYDAWKVSTGRAVPTDLRSVPHLGKAWESLRGPENPLMPRTSVTSFTWNWKDAASNIQGIGTVRLQEAFRSPAPGQMGRWGFNASTDSFSRTISSQTVTHGVFNGAQFNNWYRQQNFNTRSLGH